ncbi:MAG: hypothetical protein ABWX68_05415 [Arthrobacter sp.]|uniref:hypothetical protein n=1 Tax=Arthrobacter sp. TaxID=1667 RepID=UPI003487A95D
MAGTHWNEGEHVEVVDSAGTKFSGTVEQVAPEIGAAWIREDALGERRLVLTDELVAPD